jgi:hypothetical protein
LEIYHGQAMQVSSDADLLAQIERFLTRTNMAPSRLGLDAVGDGAIVFQLRDRKRSPRLKSVQKLLEFMAAYDAHTEAEQH